MRKTIFWITAIVVAFGLISTEGRSQDFRIETDVIISPAKEPAVQHLTLFHQEEVYDFRVTSPE